MGWMKILQYCVTFCESFLMPGCCVFRAGFYEAFLIIFQSFQMHWEFKLSVGQFRAWQIMLIEIFHRVQIRLLEKWTLMNSVHFSREYNSPCPRVVHLDLHMLCLSDSFVQPCFQGWSMKESRWSSIGPELSLKRFIQKKRKNKSWTTPESSGLEVYRERCVESRWCELHTSPS